MAADLGIVKYETLGMVCNEWLNMEDFLHHVYLMFSKSLKKYFTKLPGHLQQSLTFPITINTTLQLFSSWFCYTGVRSNLGYFNCQKYQKELLHFKQSSQIPVQSTQGERFWSNPCFDFPLPFHLRCSFQLISSFWHYYESYTVLYLER